MVQSMDNEFPAIRISEVACVS